MSKKPTCEACGGKGLFAPAHPSCRIPGLRRPWIVVERCDCCEYFSDDLIAAQSIYDVTGWFPCTSGSLHALANTRIIRKKTKTDTSTWSVSKQCST
jgi:hypothetical protein